jgi:hypothetical protein
MLVVGPAEGHDRPFESFGKVAKIDIMIPRPKAAPTGPASGGYW